MRMDLSYGEGFLNLSVEGRSVRVVTPCVSEAKLKISSEVLRAFETFSGKGVNGRGLANAKSVAIAVDLQQGFGQTEMLVEEVLKYLQSFSALERVTLVSSSPLNLTTGEAPQEYDFRVRVPEDGKGIVLVGETPTFSTPILVDRDYVDSDYRMSLATIRPNAFYGATGGPVSTLLSVCGQKTVLRNKKTGTTRLSKLFDPHGCASTDAAEGCSLIDVDCMMNTVSDHEGTLDRIVSGPIEEVWRGGVDACISLANTSMKSRADIAVVGAGGYPSDSTLASSVQSLISGYLATEHGGVVLLVAECRDGAGPRGFVDGVSKYESERAMIAAAESSFHIGMESACLFWRVISSRTVIICSRLRRSLVEEHLKCHAVRDPAEGVELARTVIASKPRIAVIPLGSDTIPELGTD